MSIEIKRNEIIELLKGMFLKRFEMDVDKLGEGCLDKEFFGFDMKLAARDLVYIYFDIEREFGITIPQADIVERRFNTLNNIADIICRQLERITIKE